MFIDDGGGTGRNIVFYFKDFRGANRGQDITSISNFQVLIICGDRMGLMT